ncbi:MAG: FAD:protein FMN transferase [Phycisphaerae bacterium]
MGLTLASLAALGAIVTLFVLGVLRSREPEAVQTPVVEVMGTHARMTAVLPADRVRRFRRLMSDRENADLSETVFGPAVDQLRMVDAKMSTYMEGTEIRRLNDAPAGVFVELSPETMTVLRASRKLWHESGGAFDVTVRPVLQTWKSAAEDDRPPTSQELQLALAQTGWENIELAEDGAIKHIDEATVDLGGIAKGYAIDQAAAALQAHGCRGGLVDVGGDVLCFGENPAPGRTYWTVAIRNPFLPEAKTHFALLRIEKGAVCTSGNYLRFEEVEGKRRSHIKDPRTGLPADVVPSVTVVAPTAMIADGWATALSVLGPEGLPMLAEDSGVEAMIVTGGPKDYQVHTTPGFDRLYLRPPAEPAE